MNRLIALLALPLAIVAGCGQEQSWELLAASPDQSIVFYYDSSSIMRERDIASLWELADYPAGHVSSSGVLFHSKKERNEYDCKAKTFRLGEVVYFDGNMGSGRVVSSNATHSSWIATPPDGLWTGKMEIACQMAHGDGGRHRPSTMSGAITVRVMNRVGRSPG